MADAASCSRPPALCAMLGGLDQHEPEPNPSTAWRSAPRPAPLSLDGDLQQIRRESSSTDGPTLPARQRPGNGCFGDCCDSIAVCMVAVMVAVASVIALILLGLSLRYATHLRRCLHLHVCD